MEKLSEHFNREEFVCRCRRPECDAVEMDGGFIARLESLRTEWGTPLSPSSGSRCVYWNAKVGGAGGSQHLTGHAADFNFLDHETAKEFAAMAEKQGFKGIGIGRFLVHIDDRPERARWTYPD